MTKRPPKLWKSREALIAAIDKANEKPGKVKEEAAQFDDMAEFYQPLNLPSQYNCAKDKADRLWRKAERLEHKRLKQLGRTLAVMDTPAMIDCGEGVRTEK